MLNRVMIIGRLGQDPQLKYSQTGSPITTFSVATDETFTDRDGVRQQRTEWFRVVAFQKIAENCSRYLHKGSLVYVEGSLQTRKWQDQQGIDRSIVEIRAQRVSFLDKRPQQEDYSRPYQGGEYGGENDYSHQSYDSQPHQRTVSETSYHQVPSSPRNEEPSSFSQQGYEPNDFGPMEAEQGSDNANGSELDKVPF
ncbi:MAG: single-stranded DNA-binding protein [Desulfovibrio sp.]|nr:single-stranded DNA-binding protein [Desulfovibrio sp.]